MLKDYFNINIGNKNRQELDPSFMPNGAIFILKLSLLKSLYSYDSDNTYAYVMPSERSLDIDTPLDFEFAEILIFVFDRLLVEPIERHLDVIGLI